MATQTLERAVRRAGRLLVLVAVAAMCAAAAVITAAPASAKPFPESIPLPNDFSPEGIAVGTGSTFYAGSIVLGDIYRGDLRTGTGGLFIDAAPGRSAVGMQVDERHHLLFVAGGVTGAAYVYDTRTGASVAAIQLATPALSLINDVAVTRSAAYFTDTFSPVLHKVPIGRHGGLGPAVAIPLTGPAATHVPGGFNLNGIVATADGARLIVDNTALGALFLVDPATGASTQVAVDGLVAGTLDGMTLEGRSLWIVENFANLVVRVTLSPDLAGGEITATIASPLFRVPSTVARFGDRLALVNARFDVGLPPPLGPGAPPGTEYDVVVVRGR